MDTLNSATVPSEVPHEETTQAVVRDLRAADARLVARHRWLAHDDRVAGAFLLGASGLLLGCALAWAQGILAAPWVILGVMLVQSVLHEMEHDLIHDLYLEHPVVRNGVLAIIWLVKTSIDPWTRGRWHRWHHRVSGQPEDFEERYIGLGLPWGPFRFLLTLFPPAAARLQPALRRALRQRRDAGVRPPDFRHRRASGAFALVNYFFFALPLVALGGWLLGAPWAAPLGVLWVIPNTLRHGALVFMSSNSHYTHIRRGVIAEQNQILDHPAFWPLQLFCWNFGATHVLHHFLVRQPFWRRTLIFPEVRDRMIRHGILANDLGTFRRANRHPRRAPAPSIH